MTIEEAPANIHTAILAVMNEVGYVQKTGNMAGKYRFAGEAEFIRTIRPAMLSAGIFCFPEQVREHTSETYQTSGGSVMNLDKVTMSFRFVHAPSQTSFTVEAMGAGADNGDKAIPKALTGALKYALRQTFLIETGDDPDYSDSDTQSRGPVPKKHVSGTLRQTIGGESPRATQPPAEEQDSIKELYDLCAEFHLSGPAIARHFGAPITGGWRSVNELVRGRLEPQLYIDNKPPTLREYITGLAARLGPRGIHEEDTDGTQG